MRLTASSGEKLKPVPFQHANLTGEPEQGLREDGGDIGLVEQSKTVPCRLLLAE
jgi:hypothetical protein